MSNPWFRFYAAALRNPKVAALSDREFRLWVNLLAVSSENDGVLPAAAELKHVLNTRLDHLLTGLERLITVSLIDRLEHGYKPHNWEKFQYVSDTSTARVRKHRAGRNVSETPPEQNRTEQKIEPTAQQVIAAPRAEPMLLDKLFLAAGIAGFRDERHPGLLRLSPITALIEKGYSLEADILPVIRERAPNKTFSSWAFFSDAIIERAVAKSAIPPRPAGPIVDWADRMRGWNESREWGNWGPKPGENGCRVPPEYLESAAA